MYAILPFVARPSLALTVIGDLAQLLLFLFVTLAFSFKWIPAQGRVRSFWLLMTAGAFCWALAQAIWTYSEIVLGSQIVNPSIQDLILFLHLVPMMAALATLPHQQRRMPAIIPYALSMLGVWWMYLYAYIVLPWHYVHSDAARYGSSFNFLYMGADLTFTFALAALAWRASGWWRKLYFRLFIASTTYTVASLLVNVAIDERRYYTGSIYDLPLVVGIFCMGWAATSMKIDEGSEESAEQHSDADSETGGSIGAEWLSRFVFVALLSVPILAAWALRNNVDPGGIANFRITVSLIAILALGVLLFVIQRVLSGLLEESLQKERRSNNELLRAREALQHQATHDSMTGVMNRSAITEALDRELGRAARSSKRVAVLLIDLDHFKDINDRFGHHAGDITIIACCSRMQDCVRSHDLIGRYGGEEFLIVIPDTDRGVAMQIAERIRKRLAATPVVWQSNSIPVSATIGLALSRPEDNSEKLLRRADVALYAGKNMSRDTVQIAEEDAYVN